METTFFKKPDAVPECGCDSNVGHTGKNMGLARAYIPMQQLDTLYPIEEALCKGTAFPELYKKYGGA